MHSRAQQPSEWCARYGDVVRSRDSGCPTANHRSAETGQQAPAAATNNNNNNSRTKVAAATRIERGVRREREVGVSQKRRAEKVVRRVLSWTIGALTLVPNRRFFLLLLPSSSLLLSPTKPTSFIWTAVGIERVNRNTCDIRLQLFETNFFSPAPKTQQCRHGNHSRGIVKIFTLFSF